MGEYCNGKQHCNNIIKRHSNATYKVFKVGILLRFHSVELIFYSVTWIEIGINVLLMMRGTQLYLFLFRPLIAASLSSSEEVLAMVDDNKISI